MLKSLRQDFRESCLFNMFCLSKLNLINVGCGKSCFLSAAMCIVEAEFRVAAHQTWSIYPLALTSDADSRINFWKSRATRLPALDVRFRFTLVVFTHRHIWTAYLLAPGLVHCYCYFAVYVCVCACFCVCARVCTGCMAICPRFLSALHCLLALFHMGEVHVVHIVRIQVRDSSRFFGTHAKRTKVRTVSSSLRASIPSSYCHGS